ncbi:MAG: phosphoribosyl-AMP cyclohydrolase [Gammaproteobacteria bacterium]
MITTPRTRFWRRKKLDSYKIFGPRETVEQVEEGTELAPKFDENGLIPAVTTDFETGELLMHGYMNAEALAKTITTGEAHYFSRSRQAIWHKGATSGLTQKIRELKIDDDQDCVWLRVDVGGSGASCHVGYRSCFYRTVPNGSGIDSEAPLELTFTEHEKVFDPEEVYPGVPNPTKL